MPKISIKTDREYLHEIVAKIENGTFGIPVFQRSYVWTRGQIISLFDSIYKGYPIGSILLWKPLNNLAIATKNFLTEEVCDQPLPTYYILDGKQRLTTFYGCVKPGEDKPDYFKLFFNLETESFHYEKNSGNSPFSFAVSDIYDTFSLLGKLQELAKTIEADSSVLRQYVDKAKNLNAILQAYTIGEMMIDNCSIDEASEVFSRINSEGTKITKASMLQAINYKDKDSRLLSDEIDNMIASLSDVSFDNLKSDDVLNCFYYFAGKNMYFDTDLKEAGSLNFNQYIDAVSINLRQSVSFLRKHCCIYADSLLPYGRQLVAVSIFFKEYPQPTDQQLAELRKWVIYTTYNQLFQNSSLANMRHIFRQFLSFVNGQNPHAIKYEPISMFSDFNFRFDLRSARTDFLVMALIYNYLQNHPSGESDGELAYERGGRMMDSSPVNTIVYLKSSDKTLLNSIKTKKNLRNDPTLKMFALDADMMDAYDRGDAEVFAQKRGEMINKIEHNFLDSCGLLLEQKSFVHSQNS